MIVHSLPSPDRNWRANARLPFFARPRRRAESLRHDHDEAAQRVALERGAAAHALACVLARVVHSQHLARVLLLLPQVVVDRRVREVSAPRVAALLAAEHRRQLLGPVLGQVLQRSAQQAFLPVRERCGPGGSAGRAVARPSWGRLQPRGRWSVATSRARGRRTGPPGASGSSSSGRWRCPAVARAAAEPRECGRRACRARRGPAAGVPPLKRVCPHQFLQIDLTRDY